MVSFFLIHNKERENKQTKKLLCYFIYIFSGLQAITEERLNGITALLFHSIIIIQHNNIMQF